MKKIKILLISLFILLGMTMMAQRPVVTVTSDTLNGAETVNFTTGTFKASQWVALTIDAVCTNIGGTSDGTLTVYGSLDNTNWVFINGAADGGVITASPKASLTGTDMNQVTITDALVASWVITDLPYIYYRVAGVGTASDSTLISIKYSYK